MHEVILILQFLQTKPQVGSMKKEYLNLYYTIIKNRDEKEEEDVDYSNYVDFIMPKYDIGVKFPETILKQTKMRFQRNCFKLFIL